MVVQTLKTIKLSSVIVFGVLLLWIIRRVKWCRVLGPIHPSNQRPESSIHVKSLRILTSLHTWVSFLFRWLDIKTSIPRVIRWWSWSFVYMAGRQWSSKAWWRSAWNIYYQGWWSLPVLLLSHFPIQLATWEAGGSSSHTLWNYILHILPLESVSEAITRSTSKFITIFANKLHDRQVLSCTGCYLPQRIMVNHVLRGAN